MNPLLAEDLSPRLAKRLASLFPGMAHVRDVGLNQTSDEQIWKWARDNNFIVVTADSDFIVLSERLGCPPQVVHIKRCDCRFRVIEEPLRINAIRISEFALARGTRLLVVIPRPG